GVVVLEELEHAKARGARIYAEVVGYGATSDGYDRVAPSGEGAERCMRMALSTVKTPVDYINPHATSTPAGDPPEIEAIRKVFGTGDKCPPISATKALTGHSLGATGVQEAIYSLLMMNNGFVCTTAHPVGCARNVRDQIAYVLSQGAVPECPKRVAVLGCSTGYGLASRIVATFAGGAETIGVSLEREPTGSRTGSAGWYNN